MKGQPFAVLKLFAFTLAFVWLSAGPDWVAAKGNAGADGGTKPITQAFLEKRLSPTDWPAKPPVGMGVKSFRHIEREKKGKYTIDIHYPVTGNAAIDSVIKAHVQASLNTFQESSEDEMQDWSLDAAYFLTRPSKNVVCIVMQTGTFYGGVPTVHDDVLTFDLRTGKRLGLADMFRNVGKAAQILTAQSRAALRRAGMDENMAEDFQSGHAPVFLNGQGLQAILSVGAGGKLLVTVPLKTLAPAGPNPNIWPQLRGK